MSDAVAENGGIGKMVEELEARLEELRKAALNTLTELYRCERVVSALDERAREGDHVIDEGKLAMRELEQAQAACIKAGDRRDALALRLEHALEERYRGVS